MADMFNQFDDRIRRIEAGRTRLKRGYSLTVDRDGLIVARPRPARRGIPWKGLMLTVVGFIAFKTLLIAYLGIQTYQDRVGALQDGAKIEQVGAWFMQADDISVMMAAKLRPYLR